MAVEYTRCIDFQGCWLWYCSLPGGCKFRERLAVSKNHFSQLLNVHGFSDVRQTYIHTAEPLVPDPNALKFEVAIEW